MRKATAQLEDGRLVLGVGLTHDDLKALKAGTPFKVPGKEIGVGIDLVIFAGQNDLDVQRQLLPLTGRKRLHGGVRAGSMEATPRRAQPA